MRSLSFLLVLLPCALVLVHPQDNRAGQVVAVVNGETITAAQLDAVTKKQIEAIEEQARKLKQTALNKLIDNLLLEQAAASEGVSLEEYLHKNVERVAVSQEDVEDAYRKSKENLPGILPPEAKYRIRRTLEDNRRADALRILLQGLRQKGRIENRLTQEQSAVLESAARDEPGLGPVHAPATVVEFSDFECPFCRSAQASLKRILAKWPAEVRLVFKHFPLEQHANAFESAKAAVCAGQQNRFWPYHDRLFGANQDLSRSGLLAAAASLSLNMKQFDQCLSEASTSAIIEKDLQLGRAAGVTGTPAYFVNGRPVRAVSDLESALETVLPPRDPKPE